MKNKFIRLIYLLCIVEFCQGTAMIVGFFTVGGWSGAIFAFLMGIFIQLICLEVAIIERRADHNTNQSPVREVENTRQAVLELRNEIRTMQQKIAPALRS